MAKSAIGISILTNGNRLGYLQSCLSSFFSNCAYRPLVVSVFDNGSTDDTALWLSRHPDIYGVKWRVESVKEDIGCAAGTNKSIEMVNDCEYVLHLESDFEHLISDLTGEDKMWLHRAVEFLQSGEGCDYLYLRRMINEQDIFQHWWSRWMIKIDKEVDRYLRCPGFWWSNNPTLFKVSSIYEAGTLPLNVLRDGKKGTESWSKPELEAKLPRNAWIHKWGLFVHELNKYGDIGKLLGGEDCKGGVGASKCKYGFFKDGVDLFCQHCNKNVGYVEMEEHARRFLGR